MVLEIDTHSFPVDRMDFGASLFHKSWSKHAGRECGWIRYCIGVKCRTDQAAETGWMPELEFDDLRIEAKTWADIEGVVLEDVPGTASIADDHGNALAKKIVFGKRAEHRFTVTIEGQCDVCASSYGIDVPFKLVGECQFSGYRVAGRGRDNDQTLTTMLAEQIGLDGLASEDCVTEKYGSNPKMVTKQFVPQ